MGEPQAWGVLLRHCGTSFMLLPYGFQKDSLLRFAWKVHTETACEKVAGEAWKGADNRSKTRNFGNAETKPREQLQTTDKPKFAVDGFNTKI